MFSATSLRPLHSKRELDDGNHFNPETSILPVISPGLALEDAMRKAGEQ
jgi:hypothetical protein